MHIELTDHLRCPREHAEAFLVLLPDRMDQRRVVAGHLGCPVCGWSTAWTDGRSIDLAGLVAQVQNPPMRKLGVIDLETFYPASDRMALALKLNGLLASPAFASWAEGAPLDIDSLLYGENRKPQAAIIELAHLSDQERQFVVTLVLSKVVTWFRQHQPRPAHPPVQPPLSGQRAAARTGALPAGRADRKSVV